MGKAFHTRVPKMVGYKQRLKGGSGVLEMLQASRQIRIKENPATRMRRLKRMGVEAESDFCGWNNPDNKYA